ncbi:hypothetical protein BV898_16273 [Hypsibius exemplaris]|uniref:Uncharacterized protein n=1 Tax=Hypsibius exemplaris TaxID=2072580 RepID=A0A9X6NEZ9_HYPEX|nr:hypothetical protein BV898_16273 [Hypsibius exemplaris]
MAFRDEGDTASQGSVMGNVARAYVPESAFRGGCFGERRASALGNSRSGSRTYGKAAKKVDPIYAAEGLTPEEVNDIRYSGIRLDMSTVPVINEREDGTDLQQMSDLHFRIATEEASKALIKYRILLQHEVRDKLLRLEGKFDDIGTEVFVLMHMIHAFLGKRPVHAPSEVTVVRFRLGTGVEMSPAKVFHAFPSPLPMPTGTGGDYSAGQKEWHEVGEDFAGFEGDFVDLFHRLLTSIDPKSTKRSITNFQPRMPLIVCRSHFVQHVVMMFEYLRQRALLAQNAKIPTKAPAEFQVPDKLHLAFCEMRAFDEGLRAVLRELKLTVDAVTTPIIQAHLNLCNYHKTTNKVCCTTYVVSEMVEQLLVFSHYWGNQVPTRFVETFDLISVLETADPSMNLDDYLKQEEDRKAGITPVRPKPTTGPVYVWWNDRPQEIKIKRIPLSKESNDDSKSERGSDVDHSEFFRPADRTMDSPDIQGVAAAADTPRMLSNSMPPTGSSSIRTASEKAAVAMKTVGSSPRTSIAGIGRGGDFLSRRLAAMRTLSSADSAAS